MAIILLMEVQHLCCTFFVLNNRLSLSLMENIDPIETAKMFYRELEKIQSNSELPLPEKSEAIFRLLKLIFETATGNQTLQFTTLFARIAYAFHQYQIPGLLQYYTHTFRKESRYFNKEEKSEQQKIIDLGIRVVSGIIESIYKVPPTPEHQEIIPQSWSYEFQTPEIKSYTSYVRVLLLEDDEELNQFIARNEERPDQVIRIQYNIADRNDNFRSTINMIKSSFGFPVAVNLLDVEIDKDNIYRPAAFVVDPDYLIDVSAIAECFKDYRTYPVSFLLKKFLPFQTSKPIMLGNIANFFLDEIMNNPKVSFEETFPKVFKLNPLAWANMNDQEVRGIYKESKGHWVRLKKVILQDFKEQNINAKQCYLEPSFYSEMYGLQGRLDIFFKDGKNSAIVELKSGSVWKPNKYKIAQNHYIQTLLYDLLVRSVYGKETDAKNYILYSKQQDNTLRYAPRIKAEQYEAIQLRNELVGLERHLSNLFAGNAPETSPVGSMDGKNFFVGIRADRYPELKGFSAKDLELFEGVWTNLSTLEKNYFTVFSAFIAREHQLSKTGQQGLERANGMAALWLDDAIEKEEKYNIISGLTIEKEYVKESEPLIYFQKTKGKTNPLANFRKGDVAVLYPADNEGDTVLISQIFKVTIIEITKETVVVTLRFRQFNNSLFKEYKYWNLEHDTMDSSFVSMYRGLFAFAKSKPYKRNLLLTQEPPKQPVDREIQAAEELTEEQKHIFKKAINAQDYFLLWGPPGTGKTSKMLKNIVKWLYENTDDSILLLAYTNRAVDEICEAIASIENLQDESIFLRLGNRYNTAPKFQKNLLSHQAEEIKKRADLKNLIQSHRIFVGTVAGFANKSDLLKLKKFERVIIDEASQILEPNLVGLLPYFEKFMLIGDHQQLPAVVVQSEATSRCDNQDLQAIGLKNLRNSFFERLYLRCMENGWDWAYDRLSHQGRMHEEIMRFPNEVFYKVGLKILPENIAYSLTQKERLNYNLPYTCDDLDRVLASNRFVFIPTPIDTSNANPKTNVHEADLVEKIITAFHKIYAANNIELTAESIGVITPYRAQIAQIQEVLESKNHDLDALTIDTVERYQGGARDIILISLCTNSTSQLESLVSVSEDGTDRKLNVALTRARQHVVILGNENILSKDAIYAQLLEYCGRGE